ncbi:serine/threonine protein kinase [Duganella sp. Leaf126]|uniref:SpoIIE family protein phosphatase n=1 Tax=Duganella sp. Leaf126 TaxID=1736266 RepID=UPI0006FD6AFF|nr:SpoIIE family protein phosphatase [Duganella sp. Leaf126]KQQ40287.1 serine/threonine protein kinase [Duganella sp. Leaf126]
MEKINQSVDTATWITVSHASDIAAARRAGQRLADLARFDEVRAGQLALIVTEAATNILKHAGDGVIVLSTVYAAGLQGIDVLAYDAGPGIGNLGQALRDGASTAGTAGNGLGALLRLSDQFDVYAPRGKGAVFFMRLWRTPSPDLRLDCGGLALPLAGETANGDAWAVAPVRGHTALMMVDGLGHGPEAAKAAAAAIAALELQPALRPARQIDVCHTALRSTRGAALAIALHDAAAGQLHFAGIGNIAACVIDAGGRRQLASYNGIVGHNLRKVQEFTIDCAAGALVVLATDGIGTQWDLQQYPGLAGCDPSVIAAVLLRDYARPRDDASVLVYRIPGGA